MPGPAKHAPEGMVYVCLHGHALDHCYVETRRFPSGDRDRWEYEPEDVCAGKVELTLLKGEWVDREGWGRKARAAWYDHVQKRWRTGGEEPPLEPCLERWPRLISRVKLALERASAIAERKER